MFIDWQQWLNNLNTVLLPETLYNRDVTVPMFPAGLAEGVQGWVWVSENFASLIQQVYVESLARVTPTLPFTPFWQGVTPYWKTPHVQVSQLSGNQLLHTAYASNLQPASVIEVPEGCRLIVNYAEISAIGEDIELAYPSVQAEANTQALADLAPALLAVGAWGNANDSSFMHVTENVGRAQSLASACVLECLNKGLIGIDVQWNFPNTVDKAARFALLVSQLSTALHANDLLLTLTCPASDSVAAVSPAVAGMVDGIHVRAFDSVDTGGLTVARAEQYVDGWIAQTGAPAKISLIVPCFGYDWSGELAIGVAYSDIVGQLGPAAAQVDQQGSTYYNGIPTVQAKVELASAKGLAGVTYWTANMDADSTQLSLVASGFGSRSLVDTDVRALFTSGQWTFVTGPSTWADPNKVAAVIYPGDLPYEEGGRTFIEQALLLLP